MAELGVTAYHTPPSHLCHLQYPSGTRTAWHWGQHQGWSPESCSWSHRKERSARVSLISLLSPLCPAVGEPIAQQESFSGATSPKSVCLGLRGAGSVTPAQHSVFGAHSGIPQVALVSPSKEVYDGWPSASSEGTSWWREN